MPSNLMRPVLLFSTGIAAASCGLVSGYRAQAQDFCTAAPIRTEAIDAPSKHAWDLFMTLNQPAKDKKVARGEPDCTKKLGTPGTTSVWETWRNAGSEVYLADGREPPEWADTTLPDEKPGAVPVDATDAGGGKIVSPHAFGVKSGIHAQFSPDGIYQGSGAFGETRLNQATYKFIRENCLFSVDGQQRYAKAMLAGKKPPIQFPAEAIEVKAAWIDFVDEKIPQEKWNTYYTVQYNGKKYGLIALHILTKDVSNWFWASFHHKDNPLNPIEIQDPYPIPNQLAGTVWANYRLGGIQTDFVTSTGRATKLSDHYVEHSFENSSCITCHATATIGTVASMPKAQQKALCSMTVTVADLGLDIKRCREILGDDAFVGTTSTPRVERGVPDPAWFESNGKPTYFQSDFVYSIPFRGKLEAAPPPGRCIW